MSDEHCSTCDTEHEPGLVLGHICGGLRRFESEGAGCAPYISCDGKVHGCDADNPVLVAFCPFCGLRLADRPRVIPIP